MKAFRPNMSLRQLLIATHIFMFVPVGIIVFLFMQSLDARIEYVQTKAAHQAGFGVSQTLVGDWLVPTGAALRKAKLPLAISEYLDHKNPNNLELARDLSDVRALLFYAWLFVFILGALVVWALSARLNQPLAAITKSLAGITRGEMLRPINISGTQNVQEIGQELEKLRLRLADSENQQKLFLRHISHEIKTPLTSIKEGSQLLEDEILGPINSEQREITTILNRSTKELQTSIENLLNFNSAISVQSIKQRQIIDLQEILNEALEKHELAIRSKRLRIKKSVSTARAFVDRIQIVTVFDNLLSNAIKYSDADSQVKLWLTQGDKHSVFTIRDYGPGISDKHRGNIFDAFYVGEQSKHTPLKGTGLGLSIARQYVELHNGKIELLATRQGAAFQVTLKR